MKEFLLGAVAVAAGVLMAAAASVVVLNNLQDFDFVRIFIVSSIFLVSFQPIRTFQLDIQNILFIYPCF